MCKLKVYDCLQVKLKAELNNINCCGDCIFISFMSASQNEIQQLTKKILLEVQVLEGEMCFHNAGGLHSGPQHVLLCGDVIWLGYPLQVV